MVIRISTHAIIENVKAKAEYLRTHKGAGRTMAWGILAIGGVMLMAGMTGNAAATDNNTTVGATIYYGMTVFEWIMAALAIMFCLLGVYMKHLYVLIVGILAFAALILSYLVV